MTITHEPTTTVPMSTAEPIRATELEALIAADPTTRILDVRTSGEFTSIHIPGSFNVPLDTFAEHGRDLADVEHPIVLVCQSGQRAGSAQAKLNQIGKANVRVLDGGVAAWQSAGGTVITGDQRWTLERQVRGVAGSIVLGSVLASIVAPKARFVAGAVGAGLTFAAATNTCAMGVLLGKLPYNRGPATDLDAVIASMRD
jgi:rhodanese-related sulfurtransferase